MSHAVPAAGSDPRPGGEPGARSAGDRLRAAREAMGLSLKDVAERTRVPIRHLEAIESGDYAAMPTATYAVGFAKAYARAVGIDEVAVARDVRARTDALLGSRPEYQPYELHDPARVPSRGLALVAAAVGVLLLVVAIIWFGTHWFEGGPSAPSAIVSTTPSAPARRMAAAPAPASGGQVTLTATDRVWLRVADATGKTLYEGTMNPGDHFDVPSTAERPVLSVGRPDVLRVTIDGAAQPALGSGARPMKNVPIDAASLRARPASSTAAPPGAPTGPAVAQVPSQDRAPTAPVAPVKRPSTTRSQARRSSPHARPTRTTDAVAAAPLVITTAPAPPPTGSPQP